MSYVNANPKWNGLIRQVTQIQDRVGGSIQDEIVTRIYQNSSQLTNQFIKSDRKEISSRERRMDDILTSRIWGYPIMLAILAVVIYMTIWGANVPSRMISDFLFMIEDQITLFFHWIGSPDWLYGVLVLGLYRGVAWVVSVMLPPMAIFFPIFALLENYGYLPRVAFNMDRLFKLAGAHGKQSLTMAMGFGCNAAGVIATRIIESPRERMIAIITNNLVPCNGRWPTLILMSFIFLGAIGAVQSSLLAASIVVGVVLIGISMTLLISWILSITLLRGVPTTFTLELPPYRRPKLVDTIVRSVFDKTLFVLKRAVIVAAPAGVITWLLANVMIGDLSILEHVAMWLDPFAKALGLDGFILMAFILGLPANEIVLPILVMSYLSTGAMTELDSISDFWNLFVAHGWTWLTALNMMLFSLLHYPCGTTLFTIYQETKSTKWTLVAFLLPTSIAILTTYLITLLVHGVGLL